jgi:hypothetical protein
MVGFRRQCRRSAEGSGLVRGWSLESEASIAAGYFNHRERPVVSVGKPAVYPSDNVRNGDCDVRIDESDMRIDDSDMRIDDCDMRNCDPDLLNDDSDLLNGDRDLLNGDSDLPNGDLGELNDDSGVRSAKRCELSGKLAALSTPALLLADSSQLSKTLLQIAQPRCGSSAISRCPPSLCPPSLWNQSSSTNCDHIAEAANPSSSQLGWE